MSHLEREIDHVYGVATDYYRTEMEIHKPSREEKKAQKDLRKVLDHLKAALKIVIKGRL